MAEYVVVDKEKLEADLTVVADAIRAKSGVEEKLELPNGFKSVVNGIPSPKPEQEKTVEITENGTVEVVPDEGKVLSKVSVEVDVESGGSEEFVGIKYSDFDSYRGSPRVADARSLPTDKQSLHGWFPSLFANSSRNANGGWNVFLEEIYLPDGLTEVSVNMFANCSSLKIIHGDLSNVNTIQGTAFSNCITLTKMPYMPNINNTFSNAFINCTIVDFKFYNKPTGTIHQNSFNGCSKLLDIYVPWSEGEVANAPWGATNATIHYNTVYDENHNPIV